MFIMRTEHFHIEQVGYKKTPRKSENSQLGSHFHSFSSTSFTVQVRCWSVSYIPRLYISPILSHFVSLFFFYYSFSFTSFCNDFELSLSTSHITYFHSRIFPFIMRLSTSITLALAAAAAALPVLAAPADDLVARARKGGKGQKCGKGDGIVRHSRSGGCPGLPNHLHG